VPLGWGALESSDYLIDVELPNLLPRAYGGVLRISLGVMVAGQFMRIRKGNILITFLVSDSNKIITILATSFQLTKPTPMKKPPTNGPGAFLIYSWLASVECWLCEPIYKVRDLQSTLLA
jgi:hypothetical protein